MDSPFDLSLPVRFWYQPEKLIFMRTKFNEYGADLCFVSGWRKARRKVSVPPCLGVWDAKVDIL